MYALLTIRIMPDHRCNLEWLSESSRVRDRHAQMFHLCIVSASQVAILVVLYPLKEPLETAGVAGKIAEYVRLCRRSSRTPWLIGPWYKGVESWCSFLRPFNVKWGTTYQKTTC